MGYQPFPITKFETGEFQYYKPWISPEDAFDPLVNAFVFRGQVTKRAGKELFGMTGELRYTNNEKISVGTDGTMYNGILSNFPIEKPGFYIIVEEAGPAFETFIDMANNGILVGNLGGSGAIDYTIGIWSITASANVLLNTPIIAHYNFVSPGNPIMLITEYVDEINDVQFAFVNDTKRSAIFNTTTQLFDPISTFNQILWAGNGVSTNFNFTTIGWTNIAPFSVSITDGTSTITDIPGAYPAGTFTTSGNFAGGSSIDYASGGISINLTAAPATTVLFTITGSLQGDYYSGTRNNLFNSINWTASDLDTGHLYMTNNVNQVTLYDGSNLSRPPFGITLAHVTGFVNDIKTTLDVKVYENSLLFIRPTLINSSQPEGQVIRWSANKNATNFAADIAGNGGVESATTSDWIETASFLRDAVVIDCDNSTFLFRFTGITAQKFRFVKINSTKSTNAPYGSIEYDTRTTSMGAKGLCYCDGVNKERYDLEVIDLFNDIDNDNFEVVQGKRFDQLQQSWMIYVSNNRNSDDENEDNQNCDKVIVYNWIENNWSTYQINLTCIGSARTFTDVTWDSFDGQTWEQAFPDTWNENFSQDLVPWMLGGDFSGKVYFLNQGEFDYDASQENNQKLIQTQIVSKRWNPFLEAGQKASFGYIDYYYMVNPNITVTLNYYVNNSKSPALTQTMKLDSVTVANSSDPVNPLYNEEYTFKRMYCNLTGQFLRLEILSSSLPAQQGQFIFAGMILWARPAGRLTPGTFL